MDSLEDLLASTIIDEHRILSLVDEYSLYCFYTNSTPELRTSYPSPFRSDLKPSWSLFYATKAGVCEFLWKDSGNGMVGNIFLLVRILHNLDGKQATFRQIDRDFELGLFPDNLPSSKSTVKPHLYEKPPQKGPAQISVKNTVLSSQGASYWKSYGIERSLLQQYQVTECSHFWTQKGQNSPFTPKGLCFSYQIGDRYKIYQPFNPGCKFLNSFEPWMVEGWLQLTPGSGDLCVITKSTKDVMVLRSLGIEAVSPRSESTPILPQQLDILKGRYRKVVTLFDNDYSKEVNVGQELVKKYQLPNICIPTKYQAKDISDFVKTYSQSEAKFLLEELLGNVL